MHYLLASLLLMMALCSKSVEEKELLEPTNGLAIGRRLRLEKVQFSEFLSTLEVNSGIWPLNETPTASPSQEIYTPFPSFADPSLEPSKSPSIAPTVVQSNGPTEASTYMPFVAPSLISTELPLFAPTKIPTCEPSQSPTEMPSAAPAVEPSLNTAGPSAPPTHAPFVSPTQAPVQAPTVATTEVPAVVSITSPTQAPTVGPTQAPFQAPVQASTMVPTNSPIITPTQAPTDVPTVSHTSGPTETPIQAPTVVPTNSPIQTPTQAPTMVPVQAPTQAPSDFPTVHPTQAPTVVPTNSPIQAPTRAPSLVPTAGPTQAPIQAPTVVPTVFPTAGPTQAPTVVPTNSPAQVPTDVPTMVPILGPTQAPIQTPTVVPTAGPTQAPIQTPTDVPTAVPSVFPTNPPMQAPTVVPTNSPIQAPTRAPSLDLTTGPTQAPIQAPTVVPTNSPIQAPTQAPTDVPTVVPSVFPTNPPMQAPTVVPTNSPKLAPTQAPTVVPTVGPTHAPIQSPTVVPTVVPTNSPIQAPTQLPTVVLTVGPTQAPIQAPTVVPTNSPIQAPTVVPTQSPTVVPTYFLTLFMLTEAPSESPTESPTESFSQGPIFSLSASPTQAPTLPLTEYPTEFPSESPTELLTQSPTHFPTHTSTQSPTMSPTQNPSQAPTRDPTQSPTQSPTVSPTITPTQIPTESSSLSPTRSPTRAPTVRPTHSPTVAPTDSPKVLPSLSPSCSPLHNPSIAPTLTPSHTTSVTSEPTASPTVSTPASRLPHILSVDALSVGRTNATVRVSFSAPTQQSGVLYCVALRTTLSATTQSTQLLDSLSQSTHRESFPQSALSLSLSLTALSASTTHTVYCMARTTEGVGSPLTEILSHSLSVRTQCCRAFSVSLPPTVLYNDPALYERAVWAGKNVFYYAMSESPECALSVRVSLSLRDDASQSALSESVVRLSPAEWNVTESSERESSVSVWPTENALSPLTAGEYELVWRVYGVCAALYERETRWPLSLRVYALNALSQPHVVMARLSDDALSLSFHTNASVSLTHIPFTHTVWRCDEVFLFPHSNVSQCTWVNDTTAVADLSPTLSLSQHNLPTQVAVRAHALTPLCHNTPFVDCSLAKAENPAQLLIILPPIRPVAPQPILSTPSHIPRCVTFSVDASLSQGHLGREFSLIQWTVLSHTGKRETAVEYELHNKTTFYDETGRIRVLLGGPVWVSTDLFVEEGLHTIALSLTNCLNETRESSVSVWYAHDANGTSLSRHTTLSVVSHNAPIQRVLSSDTLSLSLYVSRFAESESNSALCERVVSLTQYRNVTWSVFSHNNVTALSQLPLTSHSRDALTFLLPPQSLPLSGTYTVRGTVTTRAYNALTQTLLSERAVWVDTEVVVTQRCVEARIAGGAVREIVSDIPLDASQSLLCPHNALSQRALTNVLFVWTCVVHSGVSYGTLCDSDVWTSLSPHNESVRVNALSLTQNVLYRLTVRVSLSHNDVVIESDSASVVVSLSTLSYNNGTLSSYTTTQATQRALTMSETITTNCEAHTTPSYNAHDALTVDGRVYSTLPTRAVWDAFSTASYKPLSLAHSVTCLSETFSVRELVAHNDSAWFPLTLSASLLPTQRSLTFRLACGSSEDGSVLWSSAQVSLTLNAPPVAGSLSVSPTHGVAHLTTFSLIATQWVDDTDSADSLPLTFSFAVRHTLQHLTNASYNESSYSTQYSTQYSTTYGTSYSTFPLSSESDPSSCMTSLCERAVWLSLQTRSALSSVRSVLPCDSLSLSETVWLSVTVYDTALATGHAFVSARCVENATHTDALYGGAVWSEREALSEKSVSERLSAANVALSAYHTRATQRVLTTTAVSLSQIGDVCDSLSHNVLSQSDPSTQLVDTFSRTLSLVTELLTVVTHTLAPHNLTHASHNLTHALSACLSFTESVCVLTQDGENLQHHTTRSHNVTQPTTEERLLYALTQLRALTQHAPHNAASQWSSSVERSLSHVVRGTLSVMSLGEREREISLPSLSLSLVRDKVSLDALSQRVEALSESRVSHTLSHTQSHSHSLTHTDSQSLSVSHTLSHTQSHTHSITHTDTLPHTHSHTLSLKQTDSFLPTFPHNSLSQRSLLSQLSQRVSLTWRNGSQSLCDSGNGYLSLSLALWTDALAHTTPSHNTTTTTHNDNLLTTRSHIVRTQTVSLSPQTQPQHTTPSHSMVFLTVPFSDTQRALLSRVSLRSLTTYTNRTVFLPTCVDIFYDNVTHTEVSSPYNVCERCEVSVYDSDSVTLRCVDALSALCGAESAVSLSVMLFSERERLSETESVSLYEGDVSASQRALTALVSLAACVCLCGVLYFSVRDREDVLTEMYVRERDLVKRERERLRARRERETVRQREREKEGDRDGREWTDRGVRCASVPAAEKESERESETQSVSLSQLPLTSENTTSAVALTTDNTTSVVPLIEFVEECVPTQLPLTTCDAPSELSLSHSVHTTLDVSLSPHTMLSHNDDQRDDASQRESERETKSESLGLSHNSLTIDETFTQNMLRDRVVSMLRWALALFAPPRQRISVTLSARHSLSLPLSLSTSYLHVSTHTHNDFPRLLIQQNIQNHSINNVEIEKTLDFQNPPPLLLTYDREDIGECGELHDITDVEANRTLGECYEEHENIEFVQKNAASEVMRANAQKGFLSTLFSLSTLSHKDSTPSVEVEEVLIEELCVRETESDFEESERDTLSQSERESDTRSHSESVCASVCEDVFVSVSEDVCVDVCDDVCESVYETHTETQRETETEKETDVLRDVAEAFVSLSLSLDPPLSLSHTDSHTTQRAHTTPPTTSLYTQWHTATQRSLTTLAPLWRALCARHRVSVMFTQSPSQSLTVPRTARWLYLSLSVSLSLAYTSLFCAAFFSQRESALCERHTTRDTCGAAAHNALTQEPLCVWTETTLYDNGVWRHTTSCHTQTESALSLSAPCVSLCVMALSLCVLTTLSLCERLILSVCVKTPDHTALSYILSLWPTLAHTHNSLTQRLCHALTQRVLASQRAHTSVWDAQRHRARWSLYERAAWFGLSERAEHSLCSARERQRALLEKERDKERERKTDRQREEDCESALLDEIDPLNESEIDPLNEIYPPGKIDPLSEIDPLRSHLAACESALYDEDVSDVSGGSVTDDDVVRGRRVGRSRSLSFSLTQQRRPSHTHATTQRLTHHTTRRHKEAVLASPPLCERDMRALTRALYWDFQPCETELCALLCALRCVATQALSHSAPLPWRVSTHTHIDSHTHTHAHTHAHTVSDTLTATQALLCVHLDGTPHNTLTQRLLQCGIAGLCERDVLTARVRRARERAHTLSQCVAALTDLSGVDQSVTLTQHFVLELLELSHNALIQRPFVCTHSSHNTHTHSHTVSELTHKLSHLVKVFVLRDEWTLSLSATASLSPSLCGVSRNAHTQECVSYLLYMCAHVCVWGTLCLSLVVTLTWLTHTRHTTHTLSVWALSASLTLVVCVCCVDVIDLVTSVCAHRALYGQLVCIHTRLTHVARESAVRMARERERERALYDEVESETESLSLSLSLSRSESSDWESESESDTTPTQSAHTTLTPHTQYTHNSLTQHTHNHTTTQHTHTTQQPPHNNTCDESLCERDDCESVLCGERERLCVLHTFNAACRVVSRSRSLSRLPISHALRAFSDNDALCCMRAHSLTERDVVCVSALCVLALPAVVSRFLSHSVACCVRQAWPVVFVCCVVSALSALWRETSLTVWLCVVLCVCAVWVYRALWQRERARWQRLTPTQRSHATLESDTHTVRALSQRRALSTRAHIALTALSLTHTLCVCLPQSVLYVLYACVVRVPWALYVRVVWSESDRAVWRSHTRAHTQWRAMNVPLSLSARVCLSESVCEESVCEENGSESRGSVVRESCVEDASHTHSHTLTEEDAIPAEVRALRVQHTQRCLTHAHTPQSGSHLHDSDGSVSHNALSQWLCGFYRKHVKASSGHDSSENAFFGGDALTHADMVDVVWERSVDVAQGERDNVAAVVLCESVESVSPPASPTQLAHTTPTPPPQTQRTPHSECESESESDTRSSRRDDSLSLSRSLSHSEEDLSFTDNPRQAWAFVILSQYGLAPPPELTVGEARVLLIELLRVYWPCQQRIAEVDRQRVLSRFELRIRPQREGDEAQRRRVYPAAHDVHHGVQHAAEEEDEEEGAMRLNTERFELWFVGQAKSLSNNKTRAAQTKSSSAVVI